MAIPGPQQIIQVILVTFVFVFHLFTFYDLNINWPGDMIVFETTVYGIYFVIMIGYVIAVVSDGNFAPPLEAMAKLYGAILFNVLGIMSLKFYAEHIANGGFQNTQYMFGIVKSTCALFVSILYYIEMFQA